MNILLENKARRSNPSVFVALLGSLLLLGCGQAPDQKKQGPLEVSVVKVEPQDVTIYTDFVGTVDGIENAEIRARVAGYLEAAHFAEGSRVKAGDLLFTIDPVLSEAEVRKARGDLAMAQASAAKSKADVDRLTPLVATNSVSRQELDHATAAYQGADAQILAAQGALATAQASLDFTKVRSPIDGVVGVRQVSIGSLVGQGGPTLLTTVSQLDPVRVRFPVSEQLYLKHATALNTLVDRGIEADAVEADVPQQGKSAKGKSASSKPPAAAQPGRRLRLELILADGSVYAEKGWLALIDRAISVSTGSIILEARFPNPKGILRPGQFGRVRAATEVIKQAIAIPQRAIMERQSMREVYVVVEGNKVERRAITAGAQVGSYWIIEKGLQPGDVVLTEGVQKVRPGAVVEPREIPLGNVSPPRHDDASESAATPAAPPAPSAPTTAQAPSTTAAPQAPTAPKAPKASTSSSAPKAPTTSTAPAAAVPSAASTSKEAK